jgi:hypothetical protein
MVGRLVKLASLAIVAGFLVYELGSPLWLRWEVGRRAASIADHAAEEFSRTADSNRAEELAENEAQDHDLLLVSFEMIEGEQGAVRVKVRRTIAAFVLDDLGPTRSWYHATATGSSVSERPFRDDEEE